MKNIDYIPEDHRLCERCLFWQNCPMEYQCETYKRNMISEWVENVCDGDSA